MKKLKTALPIIRNHSLFSNSNICQCKALEGSSKSNGCNNFFRQYSIFNDLVPEETTHKEDEYEKISVLEKLIIESKELENVPTRSEMVDYMKQHEIRFLDSEYRRFIRTDCLECGASQTNLISTVDGQMTCTACDATQPFLNYKKKITVRKTETTKDDETTTREEKEIEETLRRMESPDNFDSDLYDNVSYLNLMSKYNQINNKKKDRHLRVRDE
ncbi:unnamed protein product [Auanema sp. JU1783]|nr:unnamed protein product [Auanema sp. JU1783]